MLLLLICKSLELDSCFLLALDLSIGSRGYVLHLDHDSSPCKPHTVR
jgi:hypothetical protein